MIKKPLGKQGIVASQLGLGCMGMSEFYGSTNDIENLKVLDRSLELGITFWDTADAYGPFTNEMLVAKAIKGRRDKITLATKFGILRDPADPSKRGFSGKPDYVQKACEASLRRLEVETIDLYYLHRVDSDTPIEDTVGAMSRLVEQGKVRGIGLSEVAETTLRKAHAIHPLTALQSEYSLWSREPEEGILEACNELGIAFVAYSPLSRGFLTGQINRFEDFAPNDFRRMSPRFQGDNFEKNLQLVKKVQSLASAKNCTPSQLALSWVMAQGEHIFPIPGTKKLAFLEENAACVNIALTKEELTAIDAVFPKDIAAGTRYPAQVMGWLNK